MGNENTKRLGGILWGMLSGASFGLIPLFTLPLMSAGITTDSILFYRFSFSAVILFIVLLIQRESFKITLGQAVRLFVLGLFYMGSAFFLLWGYEYMPAGIATTVHFLYPVCVLLLMMMFFGERISLSNIGSVILAVYGVVLLSSSKGEAGAINPVGMLIVVTSSVTYALYIIGVKKLGLANMNGFKLSFYVLLTTALLFGLKTLAAGEKIMPLNGTEGLVNAFLLALVPTVVSNFALIRSIKTVGSTTTSILGAFEPMTAVAVGVMVFDEPLSYNHVIGIGLIIVAVIIIVLSKKQDR